METVRLNNGVRIPRLGLKITEPLERSREIVECALDLGFRYIAYSCNNCAGVDSAVKAKLEEGVVSRKELFISISLVSNGSCFCCCSIENLKNYLDNSKLDYFDLVLIEVSSDSCLEKLREITRSVGVIGNSTLETIYYWPTPIQTIHIENWNCSGKAKLCHYTDENGIVLVTYFPNECKLHADKDLIGMAKRYEKTTEQILLNYNLRLGNVVLTAATTKQQLLDSIDVFDWFLAMEDVSLLNSKVYLPSSV